MRHQAKTGEERRNSDVHAQSASAWRGAGVAPTTMRGSSGLVRPTSWQSGVFKSLWLIVLVLPVVIAALAVAISVLGVMARLFPH
ncbi:hypothetical protein SAMN05446635_9894 [Burkholderia sp. OK233]|nr:hypothetical protein SAMN05446635_9894 [Burkholderia sp. OK233]